MKNLALTAAATATILLLAPAAANAQSYAIVHNFGAVAHDGTAPWGTPVQDAAGNIWSTTISGGTHNKGAVYKLTPSGTYSVVHSFGAKGDGTGPQAGLLVDSSGNIWGTTTKGGANRVGIIFEITASGTYAVVHTFTGGTADGASPAAPLMQDSAGNLWGTTQAGGLHKGGTLFQISTGNVYAITHSFGGPRDAKAPRGTLLQDQNGNFWGTATGGGKYKDGAVYEITSGGTYSVAHSFGAGTDGKYPWGNLVADSSGAIWGTTHQGGPGPIFAGTVFKIAASGTYSVVHNFTQAVNDGSSPENGLMLDGFGNLWGITTSGGTANFGVVYEIASGSTFSVVHSFTGGPSDGLEPLGAGLLLDSSGNIWGETTSGGTNSGVLFEITP